MVVPRGNAAPCGMLVFDSDQVMTTDASDDNLCGAGFGRTTGCSTYADGYW